jgi:predicted NACHT family NTPase
MSRDYNNHGRDQYNFETVQGNVHIHGQPDRPRNEQVLLQAVGQEVESRLEQSLHNAILINLDKEAQPEQVNRPWDREIRIGLKPASPLPEDRTIAQVFDDAAIGGKLLILGQPGAGKTTTLLDLAKGLVDRAWQEVNHPIPVLFNLSSWRDEKQPIREWMVAELRSKYGVSGKLAQLWVGERQLLPLLDGLDEVAPERQEQCIVQINEFLQGESAPLQAVVCSRLAEYENLNRPLQLNGAVCLKALGDGQIQTYLEKVDRAGLWQFLSQHSVLLEFVRAPLLLSVTVLAYPQHSEAQWQQLQTANDPLPFLLDAYVERMLHRQFESRAYGKRKAPTAQGNKALAYLDGSTDGRTIAD